MSDRGFAAVVGAIERTRDSLNSVSDRSLLVTRSIREETQLQTPIFNRIVTALQSRVNGDFKAVPNRLEVKSLKLEANNIVLTAREVVIKGGGKQGKNFELDNSKLAREIGSQLKGITFKTDQKFDFLKSFGRGFLEYGVAGGLGQKFVGGADKAIRKNIGLSTQSFGENVGTAITNPKQWFRDTIKARRDWQVRNEALKQALELADTTDVKLKEGKENIFAIGGMADEGGRSGSWVAKQLKDRFGRDRANVIPVTNTASDVGLSDEDYEKIERYGKQLESLGLNSDEVSDALHKFKIALTNINHSLIKGYNPDAVNLAAQVIAARKQNPDAEISLAGYSFGGQVVEETLAILKGAGITNIQGYGLGTPDVGTGFNLPNYQGFLGTKDRINDMDHVKFLTPEIHKLKPSQRLKNTQNANLDDHGLEEYLKHPDVVKAVFKDTVPKTIDAQLKKIVENIKQLLLEIEGLDVKSVSPEQKEAVSKLFKNMIDSGVEEIDKGLNFIQELKLDKPEIKEEFEQLKGALNDSFSDLEEKLSQPVLTLKDKYVAYLDNIIGSAKTQAQQQIRTLVPQYNELTIEGKRQFATQFSSGIKQEVQRFREAVQNGDKQLAAELGEKILKDTQSIKQIYDDLLENLPGDYVARPSIQGSRNYLTSVENEVIKGQKGKGRSPQGLTQILAESQGMGDDVSKGFVQSIEAKLEEATTAGADLGEAAIIGAKERLGIASPSKEFLEIGANVAMSFDSGMEGLGEPGERIKEFVKDADRGIAGFINGAKQKWSEFFDQLGQRFPILGQIKDVLLSLGAGLLIGAGIEAFIGWFTQLANGAFDVVVQFESLELAMRSVTGSSDEAAKGLAYIRAEAQKLGVDLKTAEEAYAGFKAVTRFTPLQGSQGDRIFSAFAQTASLRGLGTEEQARMFAAINQLLSKRKLSAEEVRGQLGEIPALAFEGTLSRSLGVNPAQLNELMGNGQLLAEDVLPKVAAQYAAENASIANTSETTQAAVNRLNNSILTLQRSFKEWIAGAQPFFNAFASGVELLTKLIPGLIKVVGMLTAMLALDQGFSLASAFIKSATAMAVLRSGLTALLNFIKSALPTIASFAKQFLLVTLAFDAVGAAFNTTQSAFPELQKDIIETNNRAAALKATLEGISNASKNIPRIRQDLPTEKDRNQITTDRTWNFLGIQTPFNFEKPRQWLGLKTQGNKDLSDFQVFVGETVAGIDKTLSQQFDTQKVLEDIKLIDKELTTIRSRRFNISAGDKEEYQKSIEAEQKLLEKRDELLKGTANFQQNLESARASIESALKLLDELAAKKGITQQAEASVRATLENRLADIDKTKSSFEDLVSTLAKSVNALELALRNMNEQAAYFNETLERTTSDAKTGIINSAIASNQGSQATDLALQGADRNTLSARLIFLRDQFEAVNELLARPDFEGIVTELKQQAADLGLNLENTATLDRLIAEGRSQQETAVLNALKQQLELKGQIAGTQEQLAQSTLNAKNSLFDLNKAVEDYFFNLSQQILEAQNEVQKLIAKLKYGDIKSKLQRALVPGSDTFINGIINQIQGIFDQAASLTEQIFGSKAARIQFGSEKYSLQSELLNFTRNLGGATEAIKAFTGALNGQLTNPNTNTNTVTARTGAGVVGYVGSTGVSKGAHLDIRGKNKDGSRMSEARLKELLPTVEVGGKPLNEQTDKITSGYGNRKPPTKGASSFHPAFDFGFSKGTPIKFTGSAVSIKKIPKAGNAGNMVEITLSTGEIIQLLHLDKFGEGIERFNKQISTSTTSNPERAYKTGYERLGDIEALLLKNPLFAMNPGALATALIVAAGEVGSDWLSAGSKKDLFNTRGGLGNKMQGFAQFNTDYFKGQIQTPESYINFLGEILSGAKPLPKGRGYFDPQKLEELVRSGQIKTEAQLLAYLQKVIPIIDWHGLHESGGGGARIRNSGVLTLQLEFLTNAGNSRVSVGTQQQSKLPPTQTSTTTDTLKAQQQTDLLIKAKNNQLDLNDAADRQLVDEHILNSEQTLQGIIRQFNDNTRATQNTLIDAQNQAQDLEDQYSPTTQTSQRLSERRGVEEQYRQFDNQLFEQERSLTDNIQGLKNLMEVNKVIIEKLKVSDDPIDRDKAQFLESVNNQAQPTLKIYEEQLKKVQSIRASLKEGKLEAEEFIKLQAQMRAAQAELERISQELAIAQGTNNLELEKTVALTQSRKQLEVDIAQISQDFADNPTEMQRRIDLALQQAQLREKDIEYQYQSKKLSQEIDKINQELSIAQSNSNLEKRKELELLQSQKQLEQEILEIKNQYPDPIEQANRIGLAQQQKALRDRGIEFNYENDQLGRRQQSLDYDSQIAEAEASKYDRFGLTFFGDRIREKSAIEQEKFRYEQETTGIKQQYADDPRISDELLRKAEILHNLNLDGINQQFRDLGETIADVAGDAFTGFVDDLISGSKSLGEAFADMAKGIIAAIAKIIVQMLVMKAVQSIFGGFGGSSVSAKPQTYSGFPSTPGVVAAATGGLITGPGTGTSDSIMARLSNGEFVINADAVQYWGENLLHGLNSKRTPQLSLSGMGGQNNSNSGRSSRTVNIHQTVITPNADSFNKSGFQNAKENAEMARRALIRS